MVAMKFLLATLCLVVLLGVSGGTKLKQKKMPRGDYLAQDGDDVKLKRLLNLVIENILRHRHIIPNTPIYPVDSIESAQMLQLENKKWYIVSYSVESVIPGNDIAECTVQFNTPVRSVVVDSINVFSLKCEYILK